MGFALYVVSGEEQGTSFPLREDRALTIGRDNNNDIHLHDRKLSRIHCQVEVVAGRCQLSDLNSTNGTMVNGRQITGETWLNPDDEIEIGMTRMRLQDASPAAAAPGAPAEPAQAPAESALKCEECGSPVTEQEIEERRARQVGDRVYCARCTASFQEELATSTRTFGEGRTPVSEQYQPGKELAGIRIISLIGEGRLGPLYKGEQVSMGRLVALKVLAVADAEWAKKYLHAVYTSGQLVHPNIALIFDTGEEAGQFYVVREYVEGMSAHERLAKREPVPLTEACGIITQVAYALEHASERHIFHGSLSPRKILIGPRASVKVTGFGLPQTPPPGRSAASYTWHSLPYTPPERLHELDRLDFASDAYSTVAVFYHLITGRPPFSGSTREKIEFRIANNPAKPVAEFAPNLPPIVQKIIDRGLSKDPRARYQLPREFLYDLEENLRREV